MRFSDLDFQTLMSSSVVCILLHVSRRLTFARLSIYSIDTCMGPPVRHFFWKGRTQLCFDVSLDSTYYCKFSDSTHTRTSPRLPLYSIMNETYPLNHFSFPL